MNRVLHYRGKAAEFFARWRWRWWLIKYRATTILRDLGNLRARIIGEELIRFIEIGCTGPLTTIEQVSISHGLLGWRDTGIVKATTRLHGIEATSFVYRGAIMDSLETALERYRASAQERD